MKIRGPKGLHCRKQLLDGHRIRHKTPPRLGTGWKIPQHANAHASIVSNQEAIDKGSGINFNRGGMAKR